MSKSALHATEPTGHSAPAAGELTGSSTAHPLEQLHRTLGNAEVVRRLSELAVAPKLEVGAPDDDYEREADAVAASVTRRPDEPAADSASEAPARIQRQPSEERREPPKSAAAPKEEKRAAPPPKPPPAPKAAAPAQPSPSAPKPPVPATPAPTPQAAAPAATAKQPAPAQAGPTPKPPGPAAAGPQLPPSAFTGPKPPDLDKPRTQEPPKKKKKDEPTVRAKATPGAVPAVTQPVAATVQSQQGAGHPLGSGDRGFFESRLGRDLGAVRIHDDAAAHSASREIKAQAFTYGQDIYFGASRYQPGTASGRELLAHELAHTVQQRPGTRLERRLQRAPVGSDAVGVVDWSERLLTLPSVKVPSFKKERYGQNMYADGQSRPMRRNKDYAADTRPDQRSDWKRQIATAESERILRETASQPSPAPAYSDGRKYKWRTPNKRTYSYTVPEAAKEWQLPPWNRADQSIAFEVDHLRELQLADWPAPSAAWANTKENWSLLEDAANGRSGSLLRSYIAEATKNFIASKDPNAVSARQEIPGIKANPRAGEVAGQASALRGKVSVEFTHAASEPFAPAVTPNQFWTVQEIEQGAHLRRVKVDAWKAPANANKVEVFPHPDGGHSQLFDIGSTKPAANSEEARLLAPLRITAANLNPDASAQSPNAKVGTVTAARPIGKNFKKLEPRELDVKLMGDAARVAYVDSTQLAGFAKALEIELLSPITIDEFGPGEHGLALRGHFSPEFEPIRRANIQFRVDGDDLTLYKEFSASEFEVPKPLSIDGLTVTAFASTTRGLGVDGQVFFGIERVGSGQLTASASTAEGLGLDGRFMFESSVFTRAEIGIRYRQRHWSGDGTLEIGPGKITGLERARLDVAYADERLEATGTAQFDVPGVKQGDVHLTYDAQHGLVITGTVVVGEIPGVRSGSLSVTIAQREGGDGFRLSGHGTAQPAIPGVDAELTVDYDDGAFLAQVTVPFHQGRLNGTLTAGATNRPTDDAGHPIPNAPPLPAVSPFGAGSAELKMTEWLRGSAGFRLLPNGDVIVDGMLTVPGVKLWEPIKPDPIPLIETPDFEIPLFGPVVAEIGAGTSLEYGIEAGVLSGSVGIEYSPQHEDRTHIHGDAHLHTSAFIGIDLHVHAGIGLDALVASVSGDLVLGAELRADAPADIDVPIDWTPTSGFVMNPSVGVQLTPKLIFHLDAEIRARALLWSHTWGPWNLARKEFGSGLALGFTLPLHYEEGKSFAIDWNKLEPHKPDIDPGGTAKGIIKEVMG